MNVGLSTTCCLYRRPPDFLPIFDMFLPAQQLWSCSEVLPALNRLDAENDGQDSISRVDAVNQTFVWLTQCIMSDASIRAELI